MSNSYHFKQINNMYESFVYQCITKLPLQTSVWNGWSHHGKNQLFFVFWGLVFGKILPIDFRMVLLMKHDLDIWSTCWGWNYSRSTLFIVMVPSKKSSPLLSQGVSQAHGKKPPCFWLGMSWFSGDFLTFWWSTPTFCWLNQHVYC